MNCRFCDIIKGNAGRILSETAGTITILSEPRLMKGYLLVIPRRHVEKLSQLSEGERKELLDESIRAEERLLRRFPGCDIFQHFRPFIQDSPMKVSHLHVHVRPRALDDVLYMQVQKFESKVFSSTSPAEYDEYRKLLA